MRYLGLDVGNRRVGIAIGSSEARIATPLEVMLRKDIERDAAHLLKIIRAYEVEELVAGLPRNTDNTEGEQERLTREYVARLQAELALPIRLYDERYSTATAMQAQRERGVDEKRGRARLDANAAAVILQDFLDSLGTED
jgi:putative Holliday junction resolvase